MPRLIAGMKNQGFGLGEFHALGVELIKQDVIALRKRRFVQAFGLHAKDDDHVGVLKRFFRHDTRSGWACPAGRFFQFAGNHIAGPQRVKRQPNFPRRWMLERATRSARCPEDCDIELVQVADAIADGQRVRRPWRMLMVPSRRLTTESSDAGPPEQAQMSQSSGTSRTPASRAPTSISLESSVCRFTLCGPAMWVPRELEKIGPPGTPIRCVYRVEEALEDADVDHRPSRANRTPARTVSFAKRLHPALSTQRQAHETRQARSPDFFHPGPINRGMEITPEVADGPQSAVLEQVTNGVATRMAILYLLMVAPRKACIRLLK